ncbi:unannotated protein [freshwater metagenome]|uniref:Unannotated protein n=1 Tax=freshwater metagenome TaxID=449393 RepID=A0A6J5YZ12_9ZZZZ|nr:TIM barrel protein [Actinomycetota bacterium]
MNRAIGYVAADVGEIEPPVLVGRLAELGYTAIDWTMEQFDPLVQDASVLVDLVSLAQGAGLEVPQLMVHEDFVTDEAAVWEERVDRTEAAVDAAATAGIPSIGVVTGPNQWVDGALEVGSSIPHDDAWTLALNALRRIVDHAEGTGVRVALEPCWGTLAWNAATAEALVSDVGRETLALNIDPSHFAVSGDDVAEVVRRWGSRIAHVHLKDAFGKPGVEGEDFCFLLPGEGGTDWSEFFRALDEVGYAGATSVEFESFSLRDQVLGGDVIAGAELALTLVQGLLDARGEQA